MKDLKKTLEFCSFFSIFYSGCKWFGITAKLFGPTIKYQIQCFTTEIKCCLVLFFFLIFYRRYLFLLLFPANIHGLLIYLFDTKNFFLASFLLPIWLLLFNIFWSKPLTFFCIGSCFCQKFFLNTNFSQKFCVLPHFRKKKEEKKWIYVKLSQILYSEKFSKHCCYSSLFLAVKKK